MDEKEFFARLAAVGPDGKFSSVSRKKSSSVQNQDNVRPTEQINSVKSNESRKNGVDLEINEDSSVEQESDV